jgi:uncharacterized protein (DUF2147 family)
MNQLKNFQIGFLALLLTISTQLFAQKKGENIVGKWQTEDNTILEVFKTGNSFSIKQLVASKEKEKINNGKIIGKEFVFSNDTDNKGIVIDPSNNKEYKSLISVDEDGKSLKLKVKWGFINFNETWKKM